MNKIILCILVGMATCCLTLIHMPATINAPKADETSMITLQDYLSREGDAFDKLSPLASAIQTRIQQHGLDAWDSPDTDLDRVSTWQERAVVRLLSFYCCCSNNGCVSPHLDYGLSMIHELEAVGATSTIKALRELKELEKRVEYLDESPETAEIEAQVPGDFVWADPILEYVLRNQKQFMSRPEDK